MHTFGWLSLLPPLGAIVLAITTRQVALSLFMGIWLGWTILVGGNPLLGLQEALNAVVDVFASGYNTKVILFSALVGALITLMQRAGGVDAFVHWMRQKRWGHSRRSVGLIAWTTGVIVFIESSITCLVAGAIARPLADRVQMSREKLAYIIDSTSAPVCILIPLNAWGAYIMALLAQEGEAQPLALMLSAVALNFYAILALLMTLAVVLFAFDIGPMAKAERRAREEGKVLADDAQPMIADDAIAMPAKEGIPLRSVNMLLPVLTLVVMMPIGLWVTGAQALAARHEAASGLLDLLGAGSGATAVLWAVLAAIVVAVLLAMGQGILRLREVMGLSFRGAGALVPMAVIMMLAFAINATCGELGTGPWVAAAVASFVSPWAAPALLFAVSAFIAFSTGTSWGTFGIMTPIAFGLAAGIDAPLALSLAAVLGGGVFGDHASPISDTSVIASMAAASDHIDHVRTQLPYAVICAAGAFVLYVIAGISIV